jgi:hypothetical protein
MYFFRILGVSLDVQTLGKLNCAKRKLSLTAEFGGLMITCTVRRYGFLLRTLPHDMCRLYLATEDRAVRNSVFRVLGVS